MTSRGRTRKNAEKAKNLFSFFFEPKEILIKSSKDPSAAKAAIVLPHFPARLKPCPFKTALNQSVPDMLQNKRNSVSDPRSSAFFRGLLLLIALMFLAISAHAQGCSMCYNNAAQADAHQRAALRRGILVLGIPAGLMICGIALTAYKSNREGDEDDS